MTDFASLIRTFATNLVPLKPYLRGAPPGLPFQWDADPLARGLNFTLVTALGDLDLLGEIIGGGRYEDLLPLPRLATPHRGEACRRSSA